MPIKPQTSNLTTHTPTSKIFRKRVNYIYYLPIRIYPLLQTPIHPIIIISHHPLLNPLPISTYTTNRKRKVKVKVMGGLNLLNMPIRSIRRRQGDLLVALDTGLGLSLVTGPGTNICFRELARRDVALEEDVEFTILGNR